MLNNFENECTFLLLAFLHKKCAHKLYVCMQLRVKRVFQMSHKNGGEAEDLRLFDNFPVLQKKVFFCSSR